MDHPTQAMRENGLTFHRTLLNYAKKWCKWVEGMNYPRRAYIWRPGHPAQPSESRRY
jgi:hypothetical protein